MSIPFTCPSCGSSFHVKSEFAGKEGLCPKCRANIYVPLDVPAPKSASKSEIPPATEHQKKYAREAGINFPEDINRRDIGNLIQVDQGRRLVHTTEIQDLFQAAQDMHRDERHEAQQREGKQSGRARKQTAADEHKHDKPLSEATPKEMADALENRNLAAIIVTLKLEDVAKEHAQQEIAYGDRHLNEEQMRDILRRCGKNR